MFETKSGLGPCEAPPGPAGDDPADTSTRAIPTPREQPARVN